MTEKYFTKNILTVFIISLLVAALIGFQIVPATQLDDRGVGIQLRPANQLGLSSFGNGDYNPYEGSSYSSWSWVWGS